MSTPSAPVTDVEFWNSVRELAMTGGADLALLEVAGPYAQRWLTVPASGEIAAVRAVLEPGARITVFPEPPAVDFAAPDTTGDERFHGFVGGTYRGVTTQRIPAFLAQVPTGAKWGLYRDDDPRALRATAAARAASPDTVPQFAPDDFKPDPKTASPAPRHWELQTYALGALVVLAVLAGAVICAADLTVSHAVEAGTVVGLPRWVQDVLIHSGTIDTAYFVAIFAYVGGLRWWLGATRGVLLIFGNGDLRPLRNPLAGIWLLSIFLAVVIRMATAGTPDYGQTEADVVASTTRAEGLSAGTRAAGLLCLLVAIWFVRKQVRRTVAYAALRPGDAPAPAAIAESW